MKAEKKDKALLIYVKNPKLGYCKTRLAKTVGDEKALDIYMQLLTHTRDVALSLDVDLFVFYSDFVDKDDLWPNDRFTKRVQPRGDIGYKMNDGFEQVLNQYKDVVLVGSDIAQISTSVLENAFTLLEDHDLVLGPALDGGYYLIGMKKMNPSIFEIPEWSTSDVLGKTIDNICDLELTFNFVDTLSDIDYEEDWNTHGFDQS